MGQSAKQQLYQSIERIRRALDISPWQHPLDLLGLCRQLHGLVVEELRLVTPGLRGMAIFAEDARDVDLILLNNHYSALERNFSCGHELIHLCLHRHQKAVSFSCYETIRDGQNAFLEWQANEGAAELLVPYRILLPLVAEQLTSLRTCEQIADFKVRLAKQFSVTERIMRFRLEGLRYEIDQYCNGTNIQDLEILSKNEQRKRGVFVDSLNDLQEKLALRSCRR